MLFLITSLKKIFQHPTSPLKLGSDASASNNSLHWFSKQVNLDEDVDDEIFQILDDVRSFWRV